jgi:hypothetical protein
VSKSNEKTWDSYFPTAVYHSTNDSKIALEGTLVSIGNQSDHSGNRSTNKFFLVIDQARLGTASFPTNGRRALEQIKKSADALANHSRIQHDLPADYEKIVDWPKINDSINASPHYPNKGMLAVLPFSVVADTATLPFQAIGLLYFYVLVRTTHPC